MTSSVSQYRPHPASALPGQIQFDNYFDYSDFYENFLGDDDTKNSNNSSRSSTRSASIDIPRMNSAAIQYDSDQYKVMLDIKQCNLEEVLVKIIDSHSIKVEGQQQHTAENHQHQQFQLDEEQENDKKNDTSFAQSFILPSDAEVKNLKCNLSSDGIFTIVAPRRYSIPEGTGLRDFPTLQI